MSNDERIGQADRKGKGKAKDQNASRDEDGVSDNGEGKQQAEGQDQQGGQQMKEIRRPPPLPAVKGTIGAIGTYSPILRCRYGWNLNYRITIKKIFLFRITYFNRMLPSLCLADDRSEEVIHEDLALMSLIDNLDRRPHIPNNSKNGNSLKTISEFEIDRCLGLIRH